MSNKKTNKKSARAQQRPVPSQAARRKTRQPTGQGGLQAMEVEHHASRIIALTDPFSTQSRGARLPDMGAGRTVTENIRQLITLTTDASGFAAGSFQARADQCYAPITGTSASATVGAYTGMPTNQTKNQTNARIVSFGIRIVSTSSAVTSQGQLVLFKTQDLAPATVLNISPGMFPVFELHSVKPGAEFTMVSYPTGNDMFEWHDWSGGSSWADGTRENLCVALIGGPVSATVMAIEIYMNTEFLVNNTSALAQYAEQQPAYHPQLLAAVNSIHSEHNGVVAGGKATLGKEIKERAKNAAKKHLTSAIGKAGRSLLAMAI
jgi:hypothetical protein